MNAKNSLPISTDIRCTDTGKTSKKARVTYSAKECAYIAVFVALVIALQLVFSAVPGVELVTVFFVVYAYVFGGRRGMVAATIFSIMRQMLFGFFPTVLVLYLVYYNLLAAFFGWIGARNGGAHFGWIVSCACVGVVLFTLLDCVITPLWYGNSWKPTRQYFMASIPFMTSQIFFVAVSVAVLFYPLHRIFCMIKKAL